jgi:glycosyltransferase involved in cell wall biosynthesis
MNQRPKILLLIPHLGGGGAEKVFNLLAQGLSREKYDLHLGLVTQANAFANPSSPGVTVHALGARRVRSSAIRLIALVRRLQPRVILSGMFHLNLLVLLLRPFFPRPVKILLRQNGTVSSALAFGDLPGYFGPLYRLLYRRADMVICQSAAMAKDLSDELRVEQNRLAVLPNPIEVDAIRDAAQQIDRGSIWWSGGGPHLLAVGRLSREKGFDLLLEGFPSVDLVIAGEGREEAQLRAQCHELGLESAVRFAGLIDQPATFFRGASAFVLSSRHEGMPNALLEAAAGGLPLVALPASGGITDLLGSQPGAWLAAETSADALAASLLQALNALRPGERFAHSFIETFRIDRAIDAYEEVIDRALQDPAFQVPAAHVQAVRLPAARDRSTRDRAPADGKKQGPTS